MADNAIKRLIQLVLDRGAAHKAQKDIEGTLSGAASKTENAWKAVATRIAGYLGAAFLIKKVVDFGRAAVDEATKADAAWTQLRGTIDAAGGSFKDLETDLKSTAEAFQAATIHDDDEFASGLARMVTLTGDVGASMNNMGLVANVAAQFFNGELEPAIGLVSKAMNGNIVMLQRMGIHATSAQNALEILAQRSMGAAEREAGTFSGQMKQLNNLWNDFLKALGQSLIQSGGATSALSVLRSVVEKLTDWVLRNRDAISEWVTKGINFAIDATDVLLRAVLAVGGLLGGAFISSVGLAAQALAKLAKAYAISANAGDSFWRMLGRNTEKDEERNARIIEQAEAIDEWGKAVEGAGKRGAEFGKEMLLGAPLFSSKSFQGPPAVGKLPGGTLKPTTAAGTASDDQKEIQKAMEEFERSGQRIAVMEKVLGRSFDSVGAEIDRTTKLLEVMSERGVNPANEDFQALQRWLTSLTDASEPANRVLQDLSKTLQNNLTAGLASGADTTEILKNNQQALIKAITEMGSLVDETDPRLANLKERLRSVNKEMEDGVPRTNEFKDVLDDLARTLDTDLQMAALNGADALEMMRIEQQALARAISALMIKQVDQLDPRMVRLRQRYEEVTKAIIEQTRAMEIQSLVADDLASAVGIAMSAGIHEAAVQKSKQNKLEAIEMGIRAAAFAIFGNLPAAGKALELAGLHAGLALAWGALAASTPGVSNAGGSVAASVSAASSGSQDLSGARQSSSRATASTVPMGAEVSIYLIGEGWSALNPAVQKVVRGAQQEAAERYGPNARIHIDSGHTYP